MNTTAKEAFMKGPPKLKGAGTHSCIRITDDHTTTDRKTISAWLKEAKQGNTNDKVALPGVIRNSPLTKLRLEAINEHTEITMATPESTL